MNTMDDVAETITIPDGPVLGGPKPRPVLVDVRGAVATEDGDRQSIIAPKVIGDIVVLFGGLNVVARDAWTRVSGRLQPQIETGDIVVLDRMPSRKHERVDLAERSRGSVGLGAVLVAEDGRAVMRSDVRAAVILASRKNLAPKESVAFAAIERRVIRDTKHADEYDVHPADLPQMIRDEVADDALALIRSALD